MGNRHSSRIDPHLNRRRYSTVEAADESIELVALRRCATDSDRRCSERDGHNSRLQQRRSIQRRIHISTLANSLDWLTAHKARLAAQMAITLYSIDSWSLSCIDHGWMRSAGPRSNRQMKIEAGLCLLRLRIAASL